MSVNANTMNSASQPQESFTSAIEGWAILGGILLGQVLGNFGSEMTQFVYLGVNILSLRRCLTFNRPIIDKTRDYVCLTVTSSLILLRLGGIA